MLEKIQKSTLGRMITRWNDEDFKENCFLKLNESNFNSDNYRIFKYLKMYHEKNKELDINILSENINKNIKEGYLFDVIENSSMTDNILNELIEYTERKKIENVCRIVLNDLKETGYSNEDLINRFNVLQEGKEVDKSSVFTSKDIIKDFHISLEVETEKLTTGFDIDNKKIFFERGDFIVIGGRSSMGKTAYALNMFWRKIERGEKGVFISLEMSNLQLVRRLIGLVGRVDTKYLKHKELYKQLKHNSIELGQISEAENKIANSKNMRILNPVNKNINYLKNELKKIRKELNGLDFVMIDYIGLLSVNNDRKTETEKMVEISKWCKSIARELNSVCIGIAQVNRQTEGREDKRPRISDLKQSGQIEQDASVIQMIYRDDYYNEDSKFKGFVEIITGKNRDGSVGSELFKFEMNQQRISDK